MYNDKISVVIPTYNRAYIIENAIQSVLSQSYENIEVIIVDDGSTDNTAKVVKNFKDNRIKYFYNENNQGQSAARNYGVSKAEGQMIAFEDSDDFWHSDKLEKQLAALYAFEEKNGAAGFVYHRFSYDCGDGKYLNIPPKAAAADDKSGDIYNLLLWDNIIGCPTLLVKKDCFLETGGFDTNLSALEDYDLVLKLSKRYKAVFVDEVLLDATFSKGVSENMGKHIVASCQIVGRYKDDMIATNTFDHRIEKIIKDAESIGITNKVMNILERCLKTGF